MPTTITSHVAPVGVTRMYRLAAGRLLLLGPAGQIYTSDDEGASWDARTSGTSTPFRSAARDGTKVIIIGSGITRISTDNGNTWTSITGLSTGAASKIFFNAGRWHVTVGSGGSYTIRTSLTGLSGSWTSQNLGSGGDLVDIAYDPDAGRWVAVGEYELFYSDSGTAWSACTINVANIMLAAPGIAHNAGTWLVPTEHWGSTVRLLRSADGVVWDAAGAASFTVSSASEDLPTRIGHNGVRWIAAGRNFGASYNDRSRIWTSDDDGLTWQQTWGESSTEGEGFLFEVAVTPAGFFVAGYRGYGGGRAPLQLESADGISWREFESGAEFNRLFVDADSGDVIARWTGAWDSEYSGTTGSATWHRITQEAPPPPAPSIILRLVVSRVSAAHAIALPLAVRRVPPGVVSLPLDVRVLDAAVLGGLDGAAGWAAAPSGRWRAVVVLDGVDVSDRLHGSVSVQIAADAAATAEFSILPAAPLQPLSLIGRAVRIAFAQVDGSNAQTLFSGVVDVPVIDLFSGVVQCRCHDQAQEVWSNTPRETIDALVGGRWHVAVSGEPDDNHAYLQQRIASVGASWALDPLQRPRVIPWSAADRTITVRQADIVDGSLSVDLPSRERLRTRIVCRMQYRYTRLRRRGVVAQYSEPLSFFQPLLSPTGVVLRESRVFLTADMVHGAASAPGGWELQGEIKIAHPPVGEWNLGTGLDPYMYIISPRVAPTLALGFTARYATRWTQSVTEDYTDTVVWPAAETQIGQPVQEEIGATLDAEFDQRDWTFDSSVEPRIVGTAVGDTVIPWQPDGADRAACNEVRRTLLDQAWVRLWSASRSGRVRFALPCRPDLWLDTRVALETSRLRAQGLIADIEHTLDMGSGEAITSISLAVGLPGSTSAAHPEWTLSPPPVDTYSAPASALSFEIGTYVGGTASAPPYDPETMIGFVTNEEGPTVEGREYYPHQLSIRSPGIEAEVRDPLDLAAEVTHEVTVPTDLLEIL